MTLIRPTAAAAALLVATLGLGSAAALAETSPYYIGVATSVAHDSNLERGPSGSATQPVLSDTYTSVGLRLGMDQELGRQRLQARLDANRSQFQTYKAYDYSDYLLNARLDWASVERLSGTLLAETRQSLDRADVNSTRTFAGRNLVRTDTLSALTRIGGPTMYTFDGGLSGSQVRYEVTPSRDLRQWTLSGGVTARPGSGLQLRLGARHTRADYPQATSSVGDEVRRNDIDLGATAELSGASSVNARLSRTRETHLLQQARSYSTWTGQLGWGWRPTGKLSLNTTLSRDSNIGNSGFDVGALSFDTSDTRLRTALALSANWEITGKLQLNAGTSYSRRTLDNSLSVVGATSVVSARDRTVTWDLGLRYLPLRNLELGCGWHREDRSVSDPAVTITYAYDVDVITCSAQVFLR